MTVDGRAGSQWIEIDAAALRHNLRLFRKLLGPSTSVVAVVKANAYGHGMAQVAPLAAEHADWLAVHGAGEARAVRDLGVECPILVMGVVPPGELYDLDADVHLLVSSEEALGWAGAYRDRTAIGLPIHIKVETGTNRQGVAPEEIPDLCRAARRGGLEVVGLATHFANIEDTLEHDFARQQLDCFSRAMEITRREIGEHPPFVHTACSAATLLFRETDYSMVRVGISMYGHWPSRETKLSWILEHGRDGLQLKPALTWKAIVGQLRRVRRGETVGYGRTWTALRDTVLAVIPIGYADGYSRVLGNRARVLVHGERAPVVGRVCMNISMADVTDIADVDVGDEVVLVGSDGEASITAEDLAELCGTINYEFLARLSPGIPRIVKDGP